MQFGHRALGSETQTVAKTPSGQFSPSAPVTPCQQCSSCPHWWPHSVLGVGSRKCEMGCEREGGRGQHRFRGFDNTLSIFHLFSQFTCTFQWKPGPFFSRMSSIHNQITQSTSLLMKLADKVIGQFFLFVLQVGYSKKKDTLFFFLALMVMAASSQKIWYELPYWPMALCSVSSRWH